MAEEGISLQKGVKILGGGPRTENDPIRLSTNPADKPPEKGDGIKGGDSAVVTKKEESAVVTKKEDD